MRPRPQLWIKSALIAAILVSASVFAAEDGGTDATIEGETDGETDGSAADEALWEWRLAAFGRYGPSYPASENSQVNIVPLPFPVYRGKFLRIGDDQENPIRGRLFRRDRIKLDFAFDLNFPVDSDDVTARTGMPDLDLLLEVGPELEFEFVRPAPFDAKWYLGLQLRPAFSFDGLNPDFRGVVFAPELTWRKKLAGDKDMVKIRVTPTFATSQYMDYFYTVEPTFATPERPVYEADGGYLGTDLTLSWRNKINDSLETLVGTRVSFHQGAANRDSPLFTQETNFAVYAAFTWKFWESERRVPQDESLL
jgi:outer membrane protein